MAYQKYQPNLKRKRYHLTRKSPITSYTSHLKLTCTAPISLCLSCADTNSECRTSHKLLAKSCYQCEVRGLDCSLRYGVHEEESSGEEVRSKRRKIGRAKFRYLNGEEGYDGDVEDCE